MIGEVKLNKGKLALGSIRNNTINNPKVQTKRIKQAKNAHKSDIKYQGTIINSSEQYQNTNFTNNTHRPDNSERSLASISSMTPDK